MDLTETEINHKTILHQWKTANVLAGVLDSVSREMTASFIDSIDVMNIDLKSLNLFSCSGCFSIFTPGRYQLRITPKKAWKKNKKGIKRMKKENKKFFQSKSILKVKCKICGHISEAEGNSRLDIKNICLNNQGSNISSVNSPVHKKPKITHSTPYSKATSIPLINDPSPISKKNKKLLNRSSQLADLLKKKSGNVSANASLSDFLSSL